MRKLLAVIFLLLAANIFSQQNVSTPQKFALVIGNGNYTSYGSLPNALNDAGDMADVLSGLGFTVDKVLDGNRAQMVEGITRLKNRLSVSNSSYGFIFYAGHGVQFNGVNYLIPANADIPSANYLGDTAISVQTMLAELNDARNELNVVVLDACRDFPAAWSRSANRGLAVTSNQPADSIIVYATSAGFTAADGSGRNGLFTGELLKNLSTPGLEIAEIFRRTGADVSQASGRQQIPAVYNQFFGIAYLGEQPVSIAQTQPTPLPSPAPLPPKQPAPAQPAPPTPSPAQPSPQPAPPRESTPRTSDEREKWAFGAQVGPQFSIASDFEGIAATGNIGFYTSLHGAYAFSPLFSLQSGAALSFNNGRHASLDNGTNQDVKFNVLEIPIIFLFNFHPSQKASIRLGVGPLLSFTLTDLTITEETSFGTITYTQSLSSFSFGAGGSIGVGYRIGSGNLIFDIRGFGIFVYGSSDWLTLHNGVPLLLLGYEFCF